MGYIGNVRFLTVKSGKALLREWKATGNLAWRRGVALGYPAKEAGQPQHANKTISFGFNVPLSGAIFCAGHFVERRESMQTNNKMAVAPVGKTHLANVDTAADFHVPAIFL